MVHDAASHTLTMLRDAASYTLTTLYEASSYNLTTAYDAASYTLTTVYDAASYTLTTLYDAASYTIITQCGEAPYVIITESSATLLPNLAQSPTAATNDSPIRTTFRYIYLTCTYVRHSTEPHTWQQFLNSNIFIHNSFTI